MSGEFEALGTVAEGAMVGRAFEKRAGEAGDGHDAHGACLNCATPLTGPYCNQCGQAAHVHRSISAFWHDLLHGVLHFDGKFWNTLPMLAWRPGDLTRRYIHGERAKFISPMALFLFSIFMMFAVFSYVGSPNFDQSTGSSESDGIATYGDWKSELRAQDGRAEGDIEAAEEKLETLDEGSDERADIEKTILKKKRQRNRMAFALGETPPYPDLLGKNGEPEINTVKTGWPEFDAWLYKAIKKANKNPDLLLYKLQSNGYKFAWLLIPLSIPFVWLVTIGTRGHRFYDHAVFTTYSIAFMCLLFIVASLSAKFAFMEGLLVTAAVLYAPFHMYRQLRHAYGLSRLGALIRFSLLLFFILIVLILFFLILITLGVLG